MTASIAFNPYQTSFSNGLFNTQSVGLRQGTTYPEPGLRYQRRTGILNSTETLPMWGGVGIYEDIPGVSGGPNANLGVVVGRADSLTGSKALAGFSVFDGAYGMVITPQNNVPLAGAGNQVQSFRLGSGMRIAVKCDPTLVSLVGGAIKPQVSWDFVNQLLVPYVASAFTVNSTGAGYVTGTGIVTLKATGALTGVNPGDAVVVSGLTGTGGDLASANGTYTVATKPAADTITYAIAAGLTISSITGGTITPGSGAASALPVAILEFQIGNSMTVTWDGTNANYDFSGNAAIIQL
jgi:hypothetical protein